MKTYHSVISAVIRPEIKEMVSVGLLLVSDDELFLGFSKNKLQVVKQLLSEDAYRGVRFGIQNLKRTAEKNNDGNTLFSHNLTVVENPSNSAFSKSYLSYLSNYQNNVLKLTTPSPLDLEINQDIFNKLFAQLVDDRGISSQERKKSKSFRTLINERQSFKKRFNHDLRIDSSHFENLIVPLKIDLVGKNDREIFVKSIDLERRTYFISNDVSNFGMIKDAVPNAQRFLVSQEPFRKDFPKQHKIWENIRRANWFEYIDLSEIYKLEEYATQHDVHPLVQKEFDFEDNE